MAFKDHNCTCDHYCCCDHPEPCACESVMRDPHCMMCCQHLTPGQERAWREDMIRDGFDPDDWEHWEEPDDTLD